MRVVWAGVHVLRETTSLLRESSGSGLGPEVGGVDGGDDPVEGGLGEC